MAFETETECASCRGRGGGAKRTEEQTVFWETGYVAGPVSPDGSTEEHGMWDRGELRAMDVDEKMDEDKKEGARRRRG